MFMQNPEFSKVLKDESHICVIRSAHRRPDEGSKRQPHRHPFFSIELVCEGKTNHYINGEYYEGNKGTIFLFSPFDSHYYEYLDDTPLVLQSLYFSEDFLSDEIVSALHIDKTPYAAKLSGSELGDLCRIFDSLHEEYNSSNPLRKSFLQNMAEKVILYTLRASENRQESISAGTIQSAISYIRQNFLEPITLGDIAARFYVTPNHFCKYFKKYTGTTFKNYLISMRLDFALKQLQLTKKSITEICFESGFSSPSYFTKIFTKKFGNPPSSFR